MPHACHPPAPGSILPDRDGSPRWTLLEQVAEGGQALVFRAWDAVRAGEVCVRVYRHPADLAPHALQRWSQLKARYALAFQRQCRAYVIDRGLVPEPIAYLPDALVRAHDRAILVPFTVMSWFAGGNLRSRLIALAVPERVRLGYWALERALACVAQYHALGASHDDCVTWNLLVREEPGGRVGLALCDLDAGHEAGHEDDDFRLHPPVYQHPDKDAWVARRLAAPRVERRFAWDVVELASSVRAVLIQTGETGRGEPGAGRDALGHELDELLTSLQRGQHATAAAARDAVCQAHRRAPEGYPMEWAWHAPGTMPPRQSRRALLPRTDTPEAPAAGAAKTNLPEPPASRPRPARPVPVPAPPAPARRWRGPVGRVAAGIGATVLTGTALAWAADRMLTSKISLALDWCEGKNPAAVTCTLLDTGDLGVATTRASFEAARSDAQMLARWARWSSGAALALGQLERQACVLDHTAAACVDAEEALSRALSAKGRGAVDAARSLALLQEHAHYCNAGHGGIEDAHAWDSAVEKWVAGAEGEDHALAMRAIGRMSWLWDEDPEPALAALTTSTAEARGTPLANRNARLAAAWRLGMPGPGHLPTGSAEELLLVGCGYLELGMAAEATTPLSRGVEVWRTRGRHSDASVILDKRARKHVVAFATQLTAGARCPPFARPRCAPDHSCSDYPLAKDPR